MTSLNAAPRMPGPVALVIATRPYGMSHRRALALRGFKMEMREPDVALADPQALPAGAMLLVETTGLADSVAASLVALAAERLGRGDAVVFLCPVMHADLLGVLLGTGSTLLCEPSQGDIDRALRDVARRIWQRRLRGGHQLSGAGSASTRPCPWPLAVRDVTPDRPYWLDLLSDALTNLAVAQQAGERHAREIAELLEQMIGRLLALPSDRAIVDAVEIALQDEGPAELARLLAELEARGLAFADQNERRGARSASGG